MDEKEGYLHGEPLRIGHDSVLLVDDFFVEDRWWVSRELKSPLKHPCNPVLCQSKPWDEHAYSCSVLFDEDERIFHMWYQAFDRTAFVHQFRTGGWVPQRDGYPYYLCYARSADGLEWEKPALDVCEYRGWKDTNVVIVGEQKCQSSRVILNPPATGRPGKFLLSYKDNVGGEFGALCLAYSDDGVHWRPDPENPVYRGLRDTLHNILYDGTRERWLLYTRPMSFAGQHKRTETDKAYGMKGRTALSVGDTPHSFRYPREIIWPEEDEYEFVDATLVVKCASHFLGFKSMMERRSEKRCVDVFLTFSRDGVTWNRMHPDRPFIARGGEGAFDAGQAGAPKNIVPVGENYYLYYWGTQLGQAGLTNLGGVGLAVMPRDRFVAQVAGERGGYLLTREFLIEGDELTVNMETYGQHRLCRFAAELVRVPADCGSPTVVEGYGFDDFDGQVGDLTDARLTWRGKNVAALKGTAVQIRFHMKHVGLYAIRCADGGA